MKIFPRHFINFLTVSIALIVILTGCDSKSNKPTTILIGTSEVMDLANPTGEIISRIINTDIVRNDIVAKAVETSGSGENIRLLLEGKLNCGMSNDIPAVMAYKGEQNYSKYPNHNILRSICSFYCDGIIFIVNENSGIKSFADIKGKKIGLSDSGYSSIGDISKYILEYYNIKNEDFIRLPYGLEKAVIELEQGKIDGFLYVTDQPSPYLMGLTNSQKAKCEFIPLSKNLMESLKSKYPSLTYIKIPAEMYPNSINQNEITTLGSRVILITTIEMDADTIYYMTKELCQYFLEFKSVHPAYNQITPESMVQHLTIPVHPGALKYYEEAGLAKYIPKDLLPKDQQ